MTTRSTAKSYLDGAITAYIDCADEADAMAVRQKGFVAFAIAAGVDREKAEAIASGSEITMREFGAAIRQKMETLKLMISDADPQTKHAGRVKGGFARAANLSAEQRSAIARTGAKARWSKPS